MKEQIIIWLNRLLVADVFLVLFGFLWFIVAVIGRYLNIPLGFDIWYRLWTPVFNPAIGILFLGAFVTWAINKLTDIFSSSKES
ncbi:MAG: hypothetical protein AAFQ80_12250 [Cyanobacteria bacterium J06621_8]